jgi:hypothetical protein
MAALCCIESFQDSVVRRSISTISWVLIYRHHMFWRYSTPDPFLVLPLPSHIIMRRDQGQKPDVRTQTIASQSDHVPLNYVLPKT